MSPPLRWMFLLAVVLLSASAGWFLRSGVNTGGKTIAGSRPDARASSTPRSTAPGAPDVEPSDAVAAGIDAMARNDLEEAKRILESVTADDPSYNVALEQLGQVHVLQGDHVAAVLIYEQLVGRSRENPVAHTLLGLAYYRAERYGDAELAALRAIELDPGLLHARYHIGLYRLVRGDISGATLAYVRAMRFDSGGAVYADALHELERLHDSDPDQAGVHYVLALFANSIEHAELEIIELEHFLDLEPEGPLARRARSMLANARNR